MKEMLSPLSETGADIGHGSISDEVQEKIEEIEAFDKATPFTPGNGLFESPVPIKLCLQAHLDPVRRDSRRSSKRSARVSLPDTARAICRRHLAPAGEGDRGRCRASLGGGTVRRPAGRGCVESEKIEPGNPRVHLEKSLLIRAIMVEKHEPGDHLAAVELLKAFNAPRSRLNIEYFHALSQNLQHVGYFHASYLISMAMVKVVPIDFDSLAAAAFNAYQLLKPFKHFLKAAADLDPARLLNFLYEFWIEARFRPQDSFMRWNVSVEAVTRLEERIVGDGRSVRVSRII